MSGKFASAAFVAALFAIPIFTVVQPAQAHLQPRDTVPTQKNSTQDHILPRDDLTSTFANTSDTYSAGAKLKRTLDTPEVDHPFQFLLLHTLTADSYFPPSCTQRLVIPLTKSPARSQYTGTISVRLQYSVWVDFDVAFATSLFDHILLVSKDFGDQPNMFRFVQKFDYNGLLAASKEKFMVNAFGGEGAGRFYRAPTRIDEAELGSTIVGALDEIKGFGGEVGHGCVTISFSP
jgi:hypothetical protein